MLRTRVIPVLLVNRRKCVKTRRFRNPTYLGDLKNIVRILNEKEVDELVLLDIAASREQRGPDFDFLKEVVVECFMPVCYGGGITNQHDVRKLFHLGIEKVSINSFAFKSPSFIGDLARVFGSQSIVVSVDVKKTLFGNYRCYLSGGRVNSGSKPEDFVKKMEENGAGEILLNSIECDGMMQGYDLELIKTVSSLVEIPVVACGGAGSLEDFGKAVFKGGASAGAGGSFFVFQGVHRAVLVSYPQPSEIEELFGYEYSNLMGEPGLDR